MIELSGKTDVQLFCFMTFLKAIRLGEVFHVAVDWQSKHCNSYWLSLSCANTMEGCVGCCSYFFKCYLQFHERVGQ